MIRTTRSTHIRQPAAAGMFYPSSGERLAADIEELIHDADPGVPEGRLAGLVVPHAGYMYSGLTAAYAYRLLSGKKFDSVVIISPSHREYFEGISVYDGNAYQTPLGTMEIDAELRGALVVGQKTIIADDIGHRSEHAVEVQVPFLQYLGCTSKFLPVVMGDQRKEFCVSLGEKLSQALTGKNILMVASSDLSHYHPAHEAERLDKIVRDDIASFDTEKLIDDLDADRAEMCGGGPVIAMLVAARLLGATKTLVLHHCNSGDVTGDRDAVVGYLSAAVFHHN